MLPRISLPKVRLLNNQVNCLHRIPYRLVASKPQIGNSDANESPRPNESSLKRKLLYAFFFIVLFFYFLYY